jgi:hypothetical protein
MTGMPPSCEAGKRGRMRHLFTVVEAVNTLITSSVILLEAWSSIFGAENTVHVHGEKEYILCRMLTSEPAAEEGGGAHAFPPTS